MSDRLIVLLGFILTAAGFLLALVAFILPAVKGGRTRDQGGALIIIGSFPIIVGIGNAATMALLLLSILLVSLLLILFLVRL